MRAVVFDFNGTLFVDHDKQEHAWSDIAAEITGRRISWDELKNRFNGVLNEAIIADLMNHQGDPGIYHEYSLKKEALYRQYCRADQAGFHLVKGAEQYFDDLKAHHIPMAIASASIRENIDFFVTSFHLDRWFDEIIYDDGSFQNKVDMYQKVLTFFSGRDVLVYEDSPSGIRDAYEAGIREIVLVDPLGNNEDLITMPGVIRRIEEFSHERIE